MQFTGKTVFVTGGTSGVGKETAWEHDCGAELHPLTVCAHCQQPVAPGTARAVRVGTVR